MAKEYSVKMNKSKLDISEEEVEKKKDIESVVYKDSKKVKIEIPPKTILTVIFYFLLIGVVGYLLYRLINVILILFFAFVLASATLPLISGMMKRGLPRWLSIMSVYLLFVTLFFAIIALIVTPFIVETSKFAKEFTLVYEQSLNSLESLDFEMFGIVGLDVQQSLTEYIDSLAEEMIPLILGSAGAISKTVDVAVGFGGIIVILVSILIISIYIVADHDRVVNAILIRVNDDEKRKRIRKLILDVEHKLGKWLVGQGTVSLIVGFMTWVILTIFGVPFALPIAVLAGLFEVVPNLGPVIVSIPLILISLLANGPLIALIVVLAYIILQQFQSYVLTPKIMGGVIGLHPLLVFIGMLTGFTLAGILGAALAVPTLVLVKIGYEFYKDLQKLKAKGIL